MNYDESRRQLGKAGLALHAFADLVKMNRVSLSNCKRRNVPSHLAVIASLIVAMADKQTDFMALLIDIKIIPKKPRGRVSEGHLGINKQTNLDLFSQGSGNE